MSKDNNNNVGAPLPKTSTYTNPQGTTYVVPFPYIEYHDKFMIFFIYNVI